MPTTPSGKLSSRHTSGIENSFHYDFTLFSFMYVSRPRPRAQNIRMTRRSRGFSASTARDASGILRIVSTGGPPPDPPGFRFFFPFFASLLPLFSPRQPRSASVPCPPPPPPRLHSPLSAGLGESSKSRYNVHNRRSPWSFTNFNPRPRV